MKLDEVSLIVVAPKQAERMRNRWRTWRIVKPAAVISTFYSEEPERPITLNLDLLFLKDVNRVTGADCLGFRTVCLDDAVAIIT
jgi:hypothetical protein